MRLIDIILHSTTSYIVSMIVFVGLIVGIVFLVTEALK